MKMKIKTFNWVFWLCLFITIACAYLFRLYYLKVGIEKALQAFYVIHFFAIIYFFIYKYGLCKDKEYAEICASCGNSISEYLSELIPLQLCNVSYIVIPLAFITRNPHLLSYGMLVTPFGTALALLIPVTGLTNDSIFKPRVAGYYGTHFYLVFMSIIVWSLNPVPIGYNNAIEATLIAIVISFIAHIVNTTLIKTKLCLNANYFFTVNPHANNILPKFYKLIPIRWLYLMPIFALSYLVLLLLIFIIKLF